jgi:hypothetical protein
MPIVKKVNMATATKANTGINTRKKPKKPRNYLNKDIHTKQLFFAPANSRKPYNNKYLKSIKKTLKIIKLPVAKQQNKAPTKMDNYKIYNQMTAAQDDTLKTKQQHKVRQCMCIDYKVMDSTSTLMDKDIETTRCTRPAEPNSDFCSKHKKCPNMYKKYLTGAEPVVADDNWNRKYIKGSHNCYAYFLDDNKPSLADKCQNICNKKRNGNKSCPEKNDDCRPLIPQPGDFHALQSSNEIKDNETSCAGLTQKILNDNPSVKPAKFTERCPAKYYKGAVVVSPEKSFHFYRQNRDGRWSHKPGVLPVSHTDASDKDIWVPHFANRNYIENPLYGTTYSTFCSYYCIPNNQHINTNSA